MAISIICPKQSTPAFEEQPWLFRKTWWLFFYNLSKLFGALPMIEDTHANRVNYAAADYQRFLYYETDRTVTYRSQASVGIVDTNGTAVSWISGSFFSSQWIGQTIVINNVKYEVSAVGSSVALTLSATAGVQTGVDYTQADFIWVYAFGRLAVDLTISNKPTDLGFDDTDFRIYHQLSRHEWRWNGSAWIFAPGDPGSKYIVETIGAAPQGGLWGLCDGTAYSCAQNDATLASVTTPDCTGDIFIQGGAYTGTRKAAARPTWEAAARTADENTHVHNVNLSPLSSHYDAQAGADPIDYVSVGSVTSGAGSAHAHALTDALSQLKTPGETTGAPLRINLSRHMRL